MENDSIRHVSTLLKTKSALIAGIRDKVPLLQALTCAASTGARFATVIFAAVQQNLLAVRPRKLGPDL